MRECHTVVVSAAPHGRTWRTRTAVVALPGPDPPYAGSTDSEPSRASDGIELERSHLRGIPRANRDRCFQNLKVTVSIENHLVLPQKAYLLQVAG